jgi:hypothetical protein
METTKAEAYPLQHLPAMSAFPSKVEYLMVNLHTAQPD